MDKYCTVKVQISEEDLKEYLSQYCDVEDMDLDDEIVEVINGILQDHFSDYNVIGKDSFILQ